MLPKRSVGSPCVGDASQWRGRGSSNPLSSLQVLLKKEALFRKLLKSDIRSILKRFSCSLDANN